jgi:hypothetical protein
MAAVQPTAEEKAAAEKVEAERLAAEAEAKSETEAAAKAEAEKAAAKDKPATATRASGLVVVGPVAVLPLKSGGERYVYRGTPIGDDFTKEGVEHAQSVGLVGKTKK